MGNQSLRVVFMGTPDFAVAAFGAILESRHRIICAYTQPPRPKGRGRALQKSPVHLAAEQAGIPVQTPFSFKKDGSAVDAFAALGVDVAVVAAYGLILPRAVLAAPRFGCLNVHASLLPRWRGASPIQRAIWAGDKETGITIMRMEEGLDTGPVVMKEATPITPETTAPVLHDSLATLGGVMIVSTLDALATAEKLQAEPQDALESCYAPLLTKADGRVDWAQSAQDIGRQIRALNPWPGVWAETATGVRLKILAAEPVPGQSDKAPGTVLDRSGHVSCGGSTLLCLLRVQPDNAKPMTVADAINGGYLESGARLG